MSSTTDHLVEEYLHRLQRAARHLPRRRRVALLAEIRTHVDEGVREAGDNEAAVRNLLDDLGDPEEVVAAASPNSGRAAAPGCIAAVAWGALLVLSLLVFAVVVLSPVGGEICSSEGDAAGNVRTTCEQTGPPPWVGVLIVVAAGALPVLAAIRLGRIVRADEAALTVRSSGD